MTRAETALLMLCLLACTLIAVGTVVAGDMVVFVEAMVGVIVVFAALIGGRK